MWVSVLKSDTAMSWSDTPGTLTDGLTRVGFDVNARSRMLEPRVGYRTLYLEGRRRKFYQRLLDEVVCPRRVGGVCGKSYNRRFS